MSAREDILKAISKNKPGASALPPIPLFEQAEKDLAKTFEETLLKIGGAFKTLNGVNEIKGLVDEIYPSKQIIVSNVIGYDCNLSLSSVKQPHELQKVDLAILQGDIAVAENASIWLSGEAIGLRALPFICQHLVLVFSSKNLVYNMHQAYQRIDISKINYGVFIAGPSKTADIEQSLVIGAHGPRSMTAIMLS